MDPHKKIKPTQPTTEVRKSTQPKTEVRTKRRPSNTDEKK